MKLDIDTESPFEPGRPVSPSKFKGRVDSIQKIIRYFPQAKKGKVQHFFLTGKKGMGKTSLVHYVQDYLIHNHDITCIYVSNKGNNSLEELVNVIIEAILKQIPKKRTDKIRNIFGNIEKISINYFGNGVTFQTTSEIYDDIIKNFHYILNDLIKELPNDCVFLIVDDINGLSESKQFVDWYKRFADTVAVDYSLNIPLYVLFAGYPEKFNDLILEEESFGRIFYYEEIDQLEKEDVDNFFIDTFNKVDKTIEKEALEIMSYYSLGSPLMMQQIGDSIFWLTDNNLITLEIAKKGIIEAIDVIGHKQLRPILEIIRNENYESILLHLGKLGKFNFKKSEIEFTNIQQDVFNNFLTRMVELDILNIIGNPDNEVYEFSNRLYFTYFLIKAENF